MTRGTGTPLRRWTYRNDQLLCAVFAPEHGTTVFDHDPAGNNTLRADVGAGDSGCNYGGVNNSNRITTTFDTRNRPIATD